MINEDRAREIYQMIIDHANKLYPDDEYAFIGGKKCLLSILAYADDIRRECAGECNWSEVEDGDDTLWSTSCGGEWYFTEGSPRDSGYMYCPKCGKHVTFAAIMGKEAGE